MFADDTTLLFDDNSLDSVIKKFNFLSQRLIDWYYHNHLQINWSKTQAMFVSNKRFNRPKDLKIDENTIEIITNFKLLGVWIDNKLNFNYYASSLINSINKKLFAIKRLFYLSFEVKLQFFKSFILPSFDYCLSLVIYFSKTALQKLAHSYYKFLFILLKLRFDSESSEEINTILSKYKLMSFHHRILFKLASFSFKIKYNSNSPVILKECLHEKRASNDIRTRSKNWLLIKPDTVFIQLIHEGSIRK